MGNECSNLQPQVLADLQNQTGLTQHQLRAYYRNYRKECTTSNMKIDEEALQRYYSDVFPKGDAASFASHVFKLLDRGGSGGIDFREFILAVGITQTRDNEDRTMWLFDLFDLHGTGFIGRDELVEMIETLRSLHTKYRRESETKSDDIADYLLSHAHIPGGKLSKSEFLLCANESELMQRVLNAVTVSVKRPVERKLSFGQGRPRSGSAPRKTSIRRVSSTSAPRSRSGSEMVASGEGAPKRKGSFEMRKMSDWVQKKLSHGRPRAGSYEMGGGSADTVGAVQYDEPPTRLVKGQKWSETHHDTVDPPSATGDHQQAGM